jgi:REP element-mobilizing transposase RayT
MESNRPFALHITWTCYGTWLPGDKRGHVSNVLLPSGNFLSRENLPGTPYRMGDEFTHYRARGLRKGQVVQLTADQALIVANALCICTRARGWHILRAAIMANHVHVVVTNCPNDGPAIRRILKGNSQAALNDHVGRNQKWWTAGGSDRYKNDWPAIEAAVMYVANQAGKLAIIVDGRAAGFIPADNIKE